MVQPTAYKLAKAAVHLAYIPNPVKKLEIFLGLVCSGLAAYTYVWFLSTDYPLKSSNGMTLQVELVGAWIMFGPVSSPCLLFSGP
jgi:hypothetical protein